MVRSAIAESEILIQTTALFSQRATAESNAILNAHTCIHHTRIIILMDYVGDMDGDEASSDDEDCDSSFDSNQVLHSGVEYKPKRHAHVTDL